MVWNTTLGPEELKLPRGTDDKMGESKRHSLQSVCVCDNLEMTSSGDVTGGAKEVLLLAGAVCVVLNEIRRLSKS